MDTSKERCEKVWEVLRKKYNIHNMEEFNEAYEKMIPVNLGCMVSPIKKLDEENRTKI